MIEDLRLDFGQGLTVLSGDEGAGKSLLVDALCLLSGAKAASGLIRNGASTALVEGIFHVPPDADNLTPVLEEAGLSIEADGSLIIAREIQEQGRSVARVNGRVVPVSLLREIGQNLIDIHGQMEHLSLLQPQRQLELLDAYGGLLALRGQMADKVSQLRKTAQDLSLTSEDRAERQRQLLEYQLAEVEQANIRPGEDEALDQEWRMLQRGQEFKEQCYAAYSMLYADDSSAATLARQAIKSLGQAISINPALQPQVEGLEGAVVELEETARVLSRYIETVDDSPQRLQQVEERLELLRRLKRKYGPTLEDVFRFHEELASGVHTLEEERRARDKLLEELQRFSSLLASMAEQLSRKRKEKAKDLEKATHDLRLANLQLRKLDKAKSEFISIASHELRTPMTAIRGHLWMLSEGRGGRLTRKQAEYVENALEGTERMIRLISDMLDVSRIEQRVMRLNKKKIDVVSLAKK